MRKQIFSAALAVTAALAAPALATDNVFGNASQYMFTTGGQTAGGGAATGDIATTEGISTKHVFGDGGSVTTGNGTLPYATVGAEFTTTGVSDALSATVFGQTAASTGESGEVVGAGLASITVEDGPLTFGKLATFTYEADAGAANDGSATGDLAVVTSHTVRHVFGGGAADVDPSGADVLSFAGSHIATNGMAAAFSGGSGPQAANTLEMGGVAGSGKTTANTN